MVAREKVCSVCGRRLPLDKFRREAKGRGGRNARCRACCSAVEKVQAAERAHKAKHWGPLPGREGSAEYVAEMERRKAQISLRGRPTA